MLVVEPPPKGGDRSRFDGLYNTFVRIFSQYREDLIGDDAGDADDATAASNDDADDDGGGDGDNADDANLGFIKRINNFFMYSMFFFVSSSSITLSANNVSSCFCPILEAS